jgi:polyhydroxybutyrate depolymerase
MLSYVRTCCSFSLVVFSISIVLNHCSVAAEPVSKTWTVNQVERSALIVPATKKTEQPPLIFIFHGHGGTARHALQSMSVHKHWPEAIVVAPQGLNTPSPTDPEGKRSGWQRRPGDQEDRDLVLFDAILKTALDEHHVDPNRVYVTGHSNGGAMTYLLWQTRHTVLAAIAPSGAGGQLRGLSPLPALHIAGKKDQIVPFAAQERIIQSIRVINECAEEGTEWNKLGTQYASKKNAPVVTYLYDGGHEYPAAGPELTAKFFQEHQRPAPMAK